MRPRDDRFVICKTALLTNPWTVWLPIGQRWIQSTDGRKTMNAQGAGVENFDAARKLVIRRLQQLRAAA